MINKLLNNSEPRVAELFRRLECIKTTLDRLETSNRQSFGGERFISDRDLSVKLKLSSRALQEYWAAGVFPYYLISGKVIYKESEIERVLQSVRKAGKLIEELV